MFIKDITHFLSGFGLVSFLIMTACGGGSGSAGTGTATPDDTEEGSTAAQDPAENPETAANPETAIAPSNTTSETAVTDGQVVLSVAITLEEEEESNSTLRVVTKSSITDQVSRVYLEVIVQETVYSTTDLTADENDPLVYTGLISIPVNVEVALHAVALSSDATILFEGRTEGIVATEYGTPAIQMYLERQVPTEDSEANSAPVIHSVYVGDKSLAYGESANVSVDAEDPQDDVLTYLWSVASGPEGVDTTTLMSNSDQQGATFTAPTVEGLYTVQITVTDDQGASSTAELVLYVSETGVDDEPEVEVILSDFPDCTSFSAFSGTCVDSDEIGDISITNTKPVLTSLTTSFRYETDEGTTTYSASQLYSLGMTFQWSDTCSGDNFIEVNAEGNQIAVESSTQVTPSFVKTNLDEESCQITLQLADKNGLTETYQFVLNYSDEKNNYSQELNCDEDPGNVYPKVKLTCPDEMSAVPGTVTLEACDAQGDLSSITLQSSSGSSSLWTWYTSNLGKILYGPVKFPYSTNYINGQTIYVYLSGAEGTATYSVVPYYTSYDAFKTLQIAEGTDAVISTDYYQPMTVDEVINPIGIILSFEVNDLAGHRSSAYCTFSIAPDIDLALPY